jgi:hypothetical protein
MCGRNLITGLTSSASPRVDISSTCKIGQKLGVSLHLLTWSPSAWPSRLLHHRGRKSRRDLWITMYKKLFIVASCWTNFWMALLQFVLFKLKLTVACYYGCFYRKFKNLQFLITIKFHETPLPSIRCPGCCVASASVYRGTENLTLTRIRTWSLPIRS